METSQAIDTALVYLDKLTVSGVNNVLSLSRALDALLQAKQMADSEKTKEVKPDGES